MCIYTCICVHICIYVCICDKELKTSHSLTFFLLHDGQPSDSKILTPILYLHKRISSQIINVNKYQLLDAC